MKQLFNIKASAQKYISDLFKVRTHGMKRKSDQLKLREVGLWFTQTRTSLF